MYFPAVLYVCTGFCCLEIFPSPKVQNHEVGEPVLSSEVNLTFSGAFPEVGIAEKSATGRTGFAERGPINCPKATGLFPTVTAVVTVFVDVSITETLLLP